MGNFLFRDVPEAEYDFSESLVAAVVACLSHFEGQLEKRKTRQILKTVMIGLGKVFIRHSRAHFFKGNGNDVEVKFPLGLQ